MNRPEDIINRTSSIDEELFEIFHLINMSYYLTKRQMKIVKMKLKGYRHIEIAKEIGVCPATITQEFYKIRKRLKEVKYLDND